MFFIENTLIKKVTEPVVVDFSAQSHNVETSTSTKTLALLDRQTTINKIENRWQLSS